jgi:hypothetical protein
MSTSLYHGKYPKISPVNIRKYSLDKQMSPSYPAPAEKQVLIRPESEQVLIGIIQKQEEESS